jgi:hypothetical protein
MSQNMREQIQKLDIKVESARAPREYGRFDDFTSVTDVRSNHGVLVLGSPSYFHVQTLRQLAGDVEVVKKKGDVDRLLAQNVWFDRVFVFNEGEISNDLVQAAIGLTHPDGLTSFFLEETAARDTCVSFVEEKYPEAQAWQTKSNAGPVVMTDSSYWIRQ